MKRCMLAASFLCFISFSQAMSSGVETASAKIVGELKKEYSKRVSQDVMLADFITLNAPESAFGAYLTGTLTDAFKHDPGVTILDQQKVDAVLEAKALRFNDGVEFSTLEGLSQAIFEATHNTPTAICFGRIEEWGVDEIRITVKMIDAMTGDPIAVSSVTFPGDETTDRLLGKPVRERKPVKPDTVVIVKERIVEKPVERIVEKPAEKPAEAAPAKTIEVYTAKSIEPYKGAQEFKTQGFVVMLKRCYYSGNYLMFDFVVTNTNDMTKDFFFRSSRLIDDNGNSVNCDRIDFGARSGGSYVRIDLVSNVPVKAVMKFKDVSMKLTSVKALQIVAEDHEFVLRDIPIEKE